VWRDSVPGCTAPAILSPRPEAFSDVFWVVDFWESGVTLGELDQKDIGGRTGQAAAGVAYSSQSPARQDPCGGCQTC